MSKYVAPHERAVFAVALLIAFVFVIGTICILTFDNAAPPADYHPKSTHHHTFVVY